MVKVSDCSCECRDKGKEKMIEERALSSVNKIISTEGTPYYPDGTGSITMPVATPETVLNAKKVPGIEDEIKQLTISDAETDEAVRSLEIAADSHTREIQTIKATDQTQNNQIIALQALTDSITKSLITDVEVKTGTDAGSFIVSVVEEDGTKRSSDNFQYGRIGTFELLQGNQAGYVRGRLTLVDGTTITSNDFQILQVTATDIYVTSITLTPDYQAGEIGGEIGYSNGSTAAINSIKVPTAPGVTTNINDLLGRMSTVESKNTAQDSQIGALDTRVTALEGIPGVAKFTNTALGTIMGSTADGKITANSDGTGSVNGWSSKANQSDLTALQNGVMKCFEGVDYTPATNTLTLTALNGQSKGITLDKNWGTANVGKVLEVGRDGMASPVDNTGPGGFEWKTGSTIPKNAKFYKVKFHPDYIENIQEELTGNHERVSDDLVASLNKCEFFIANVHLLDIGPSHYLVLDSSIYRTETTNTTINFQVTFYTNADTDNYFDTEINIISITKNDGSKISLLNSSVIFGKNISNHPTFYWIE